MSTFIPLPSELDLSDVPSVQLPPEQEKLANALLTIEAEQFYLESIKEWTHINREQKRKLIREHEAKLWKAQQKLKRLSFPCSGA
jgi:hypothetical protein